MRPGISQNCGEAGVIGVLPGIIGTLQANEVIKIISGLGECLAGFLLIFDALSTSFKKLSLAKQDLSQFSQAALDKGEILYDDLMLSMKAPNAPFLLDVRELNERQEVSIGGEHIPLLRLPNNFERIPVDRDIVIYCKSGVRSAKAALYLRSILANSTILSLKGGLDGTGCSLALVD